MRRPPGVSLAAVTAIAIAIAGSTAGPAKAAAAPVDTPVQFVVEAAPLEITAPTGDPVQLGSGAAGTEISGELGDVTVTGDGPWVATVTASDFASVDTTPVNLMMVTAASYWSGATVDSQGVEPPIPGQAGADDAVQLTTAGATAFSYQGEGTNNATWNPTLVINVPVDSPPGTYSGTVTHSVA